MTKPVKKKQSVKKKINTSEIISDHAERIAALEIMITNQAEIITSLTNVVGKLKMTQL